MATATARRRRAIERLVATDLARARLARAAFDAVVDGLDLGPIALRSSADRAWVRVAIAGPIQHAADQALAGLVEDLIEALTLGDPALVARMLAASPEGLVDDGSTWRGDVPPARVAREWRTSGDDPDRLADRDANPERTLLAVVG